jgi:EAL domain-containing protein (putative c-di-GMP-specific phosphodiesterase class I)
MAEWVRTSGEHDAYISVNVSPRQLRHDLAELVHDVLAETGLDARHLVLELTESALVDDAADVVVLERLRASGVRIAVDDFGTGYSSLSYLRELPIDVVKIDRSFVQDVTQGGTGEALIDAIVHLCGALDLQVIAEGVETTTELDVLRDLGVPSVQGFLFARPRPADQQSPRFSAPTAAATTTGT